MTTDISGVTRDVTTTTTGQVVSKGDIRELANLTPFTDKNEPQQRQTYPQLSLLYRSGVKTHWGRPLAVEGHSSEVDFHQNIPSTNIDISPTFLDFR